jgi:hypothetical protein
MTIWPDLGNSVFEFLGGLAAWANVRALMRARRVIGVSWLGQTLFASWAWWNLFYYPSLGQWASLGAGFLIAAANATWVVLAIRYRMRPIDA